MEKKIFKTAFILMISNTLDYRHEHPHVYQSLEGCHIEKKNFKTSFILMISNTLGYRHEHPHVIKI